NGERAEPGGRGERERVLGEDRSGEVAGIDEGTHVDAELLEHGALHLGDGDLQHDLVLALDAEEIDHELGGATAGRGGGGRHLRLGLGLTGKTGVGVAGDASRARKPGYGRHDACGYGAVGGHHLAGDVLGPLGVDWGAYGA